MRSLWQQQTLSSLSVTRNLSGLADDGSRSGSHGIGSQDVTWGRCQVKAWLGFKDLFPGWFTHKAAGWRPQFLRPLLRERLRPHKAANLQGRRSESESREESAVSSVVYLGAATMAFVEEGGNWDTPPRCAPCRVQQPS